jgi:hypothetical protein
MLRSTLILIISTFIACGHNEKVNNTSNAKTLPVTVPKIDKIDNALRFINGYIENINRRKQAVDIVDWVSSNDFATKGFKAELKRILDEAYKEEPEVGLDFDPILNAQDNPDNGFELESFDEKTNYLTVKGKEWPDFKVTMRIKEENGSWLVDGCGIVNIPNEKGVER